MWFTTVYAAHNTEKTKTFNLDFHRAFLLRRWWYTNRTLYVEFWHRKILSIKYSCCPIETVKLLNYAWKQLLLLIYDCCVRHRAAHKFNINIDIVRTRHTQIDSFRWMVYGHVLCIDIHVHAKSVQEHNLSRKTTTCWILIRKASEANDAKSSNLNSTMNIFFYSFYWWCVCHRRLCVFSCVFCLYCVTYILS